jgi:ferredoxin
MLSATFEMDDNGLAKEKENLTEEQKKEAEEAVDICPVGAIQKVEENE